MWIGRINQSLKPSVGYQVENCTSELIQFNFKEEQEGLSTLSPNGLYSI